MKEFVLMNKETGDLGVGVRATLTDAAIIENEIANLDGYSIQVRKNDFDGWLVVAAEGQPYLYAPKDMVELKVEVLGVL